MVQNRIEYSNHFKTGLKFVSHLINFYVEWEMIKKFLFQNNQLLFEI
jgi:hypothetical protein